MRNSTRFDQAIALIDAANAEDPNLVSDGGAQLSTELPTTVAKELLYAQRMTEMLARYAPEAPEAVQLAARAQHVQRWKIPRRDYPMTTGGYKQWRTTLYGFHADLAARLLLQAGYDEATIERVRKAVGKKEMASNADTRLLEDVVALVFLEYYMADFAARHADYDERKWHGIIRKTWLKMTDPARAFALSGAVRLPAHLVPLITQAISSP